LRSHEESLVRDVALRIDIASGRLTESNARAALAAPDQHIRERALDAMHARGWLVESEAFERIVENSYASSPRTKERRLLQAVTEEEAALRSRLNWYLPWSELVYKALGLAHFDAFGDQVRRDLGDTFETFRSESREDLLRRFGERGAGELATEFSMREGQYLEVALAVLAEKGTGPDAALVTRYLTHGESDVQFAALLALWRLSPARAAQEAERLAGDDSWSSEQRQQAARIAIELSPSAALTLTQSADASVASVAATLLPDGSQSVERLTELLLADDDKLREVAVKRLASQLSIEELTGVLNRYLTSRYYYNVVVWLDRFIYCPEPFLGRYLAGSAD
jgi:hypothetical protein